MALPPRVNTKQDETGNCATMNATILEVPGTARASTSKRKRGNEDRSHEISGEEASPQKEASSAGAQVFPCPLAHEFGCSDMVTTKRGAILHSNRHSHLISYPCPYAEKFGCYKTFDLAENAKDHGKHHFPPTYRCPYADNGCDRMFYRASNAQEHGRTHEPKVCKNKACFFNLYNLC